MGMTDNEIGEWLHSRDIYDYDICDGVVHVVRGVYISGIKLTSIPVQFGYVGGDFHCTHNWLESLEGCPSEVGGNFYCFSNALISLEGCPSEVGGNFKCSDNMFEAKPDHSHIRIGGDFTWERQIKR
jgi:hypothetical protein